MRARWTTFPRWDDRTFYDFVASSKAFSSLSFQHREVFGHVGFGTGGWDSDYPNSMLEIFRVAMTNCDQDQRLRRRAGSPRALAPSRQNWLLTTQIDCEESLFSQKI
jgi:hypothetical protein